MRIFFLRINRRVIIAGSVIILLVFYITISTFSNSLNQQTATLIGRQWPPAHDGRSANLHNDAGFNKPVTLAALHFDKMHKAPFDAMDNELGKLPAPVEIIDEQRQHGFPIPKEPIPHFMDNVPEAMAPKVALSENRDKPLVGDHVRQAVPENLGAIEDSIDAIHKAANIEEDDNLDVLPEPVDNANDSENKKPAVPVEAPRHSVNEDFPPDLFPKVPPPKSDSESSGPGEGGQPVMVDRETLSAENKAKYDLGESRNAFNQYASSLISVRRYIPDIRDPECLSLKYNLPMKAASIIITFHEEDWGVLLRSVHSIFDRSPPELVHEVILVDDASSYPHLKRPLEIYMEFFKKVKIVRAPERQGLIRARMLGAKAASGGILLFLDSHIECTEGWLMPLLHRIAENPRNVVVPVIDVISKDTIQYSHSGADRVQVGGFDWGLQFRWHTMPKRDANRPGAPVSPVRTPTMAGGLFAISYEFFAELGWYDPGYEVWGAENLELSFKTWMCGGTLETIPCSRVGHIFRSRSPYSWQVKQKNPLRHNLLRLAEVLLDEYKNYYFARVNFKLSDMGDVSERKEILKKLNCKSFKWYLDNIYPEMFDPSSALASGEIRNADNMTCIDAPIPSAHERSRVAAFPCHQQGGNQFWLLSKDGELRRDDHCADTGFGKDELNLSDCHSQQGNQLFKYSGTEIVSGGGLCVTLTNDKRNITLATCRGSQEQLWMWNRKGYRPFNEAKL